MGADVLRLLCKLLFTTGDDVICSLFFLDESGLKLLDRGMLPPDSDNELLLADGFAPRLLKTKPDKPYQFNCNDQKRCISSFDEMMRIVCHRFQQITYSLKQISYPQYPLYFDLYFTIFLVSLYRPIHANNLSAQEK